MTLAAVALDDKYALETGRIYLTGSQALVRLPMVQRRRDVAAGLNTACFISGYRGSPMHAVDQQLWRAPKFVAENHIHFQPGLNEDLAATSVWGSQQAGLFGDAKYDGVFSMWYGKGPGLDRSVDAIRHGHYAGSSKHGGVLVLAGDDHGMRSTDVPATCEPTFHDMLMPILYPANVQEVLDFGLYGWALSRFAGCWVGMKMIFETVDTSASIDVDPTRLNIVLPEVEMPADGLNIRVPDVWFDQEPRHRTYKIPAARAFGTANGLNRQVIGGARRRFGIVASGKSYLDVLQALRDLGLSVAQAEEIGVTVFKIGMPFPLDPEALRRFGDGLEEILVVEEKRRLIETELKDALYSLPESRRPRVVGRYDENHQPMLPELGEMTPTHVTLALANRLARFHSSQQMDTRVGFLKTQAERRKSLAEVTLKRTPYFCSGCPHNTSTKVPEGSRAGAGVGCHFMASYMDRETYSTTQMGGEGANWIGQQPFVTTSHIFQNLGDGTYLHSGLLAIRAAVAAGTNITYKILFNDAVAMTGGQPHDVSGITPWAISRQVAAEGVEQIAVVTDEPDKYPVGTRWAEGVTVYHRRDLDEVQRTLREVPGVTALIYDQTCAAEKRRRRKRGTFPDPAKRMFINERVCEGCGDCSVKSNCLSVLPVDTAWGRKRRIDQSNCNKDYSCAEGFCPSFVAVLGGGLRKAPGAENSPAEQIELPAPAPAEIPVGDTYRILVTGVGGTGVVTIGALLGMAAHLEGKGVSVVDQLGMAQKGGPVISHVQVGERPEDIAAVRLATGDANLLLGCDMLVAGSDAALETVDPSRTKAVINTHQAITGDFTRDPDLAFPTDAVEGRIADMVGRQSTSFVDATRLATKLLGDSLATNLFMLGYAYQKGLLPVSAEAIGRAIELNGAAVDWNKRAFAWGRRTVIDPVAVQQAAEPTPVAELPEDLDALTRRLAADLTAYQDAAYAKRFTDLVEATRNAEAERAKGFAGLAETVARNLHKLMAYKDEYEVARLYTDGEFQRRLAEQFEGDVKLQFLMAPPLLASRHPRTGEAQKMTFGPWMFTALKLLAKLKGLRGTWADPFGRTAERREERRLIGDYEATVRELIAGLETDNHALAIEIADIANGVRGFGHVKATNVALAKKKSVALLQRYKSPDFRASAAE
ncbi:MAG: indolepyruvate ferredoxin oxidoreductase family protein [Alphaproteobacteria bacterium]